MKILQMNETVYIRHWLKWYVGSNGDKKLERLKFGDVDDLFDMAMDSLMEGKKHEKNRKANTDHAELTELLDDSFLDDNGRPSKSGYKTKRNK